MMQTYNPTVKEKVMTEPTVTPVPVTNVSVKAVTKYSLQLIENVVTTFSFTLLSVLGANGVFDITHTDWKTDLGIAGGAAFLQFLKSVAGQQVGDKTTTSLVN